MGLDIGTYSFDFIVEKYGNLLSFDVRKESDLVPEQFYKLNFLDLQNVGETSTTDPPPGQKDEYGDKKFTDQENNLAFPLMVEGALAHHTVLNQVIIPGEKIDIGTEESQEESN